MEIGNSGGIFEGFKGKGILKILDDYFLEWWRNYLIYSIYRLLFSFGNFKMIFENY